jgi:hypothetical protein
MLVSVSGFLLAQSRKERKEAKIEESAKPKAVAGGVRFQVQKAYLETYDALLNWAKRADYTIDRGDRDNGQIITGMTVTGGYSQTGTRVVFTIIKESETLTTVKLALTEQKRKKLLSTEPWSDPKVNEKESEKLAERVKSAMASS